MQIDTEQNQPPQEDGKYCRYDPLDRAQVAEVVVLLSNDHAHDDIDDDEDARYPGPCSHGSSISS